MPDEVRREAGLAPRPVAERDHVGAAREQPVGDLRRDPAAGGRVLAVDDAEVRPELAAQRREPLLDRAAAGAPNTSATKRMRTRVLLADGERRRGMNLDDDVVARVVRVVRERLTLGVREVDDRAEP